MKLGIVFAALLLGLVAFGQPAVAAKPAPSGTIAIAAGSDLNLGGNVTFDWTVSDIGSHDARIQIVCTQATAVTEINPDGIVYAEAGPGDHTFLLGGASSQWIINGGPADCVATLYYFDWHPVTTFNPLAEVSFTAGG